MAHLGDAERTAARRGTAARCYKLTRCVNGLSTASHFSLDVSLFPPTFLISLLSAHAPSPTLRLIMQFKVLSALASLVAVVAAVVCTLRLSLPVYMIVPSAENRR